MTKKLLTVFTIVLLNTMANASDLGICTIDNKRPITLTYKGNGNILVIDGKYTAKLYDGDIFVMNGKSVSFDAYANKKYAYFVETVDGQDQLTVIPARYIHGIGVDEDHTKVVYSCKWYK